MNNWTEKWHKHFFAEAKLISTLSKDPSTQVGAVIVRPDKTIAAKGFNGFPRGIEDKPEYYNDRSKKYDLIIHAEMNAILNSWEPVKGYALYTYPFAPCIRCAVHIIQAGIKYVYFPVLPEHLRERWQHSVNESCRCFKEAGVTIGKFQV